MHSMKQLGAGEDTRCENSAELRKSCRKATPKQRRSSQLKLGPLNGASWGGGMTLAAVPTFPAEDKGW